MRTEASSKRVPRDVAGKREHVRLGLDQFVEEAALEHVTREVVLRVEPPCVAPVEVAHPGRDVLLQRLNLEVEVVRHQAVRVDAPSVPLCDIAEDLEKRERVAFGDVDRLPSVAARPHVVDDAGQLDAGVPSDGDERSPTRRPRRDRAADRRTFVAQCPLEPCPGARHKDMARAATPRT